MNKLNIKYLNTLVITSLVPFLDKYPELKDILNASQNSASNWDFFMTVAGAGLYLTANEKVDDNEIRNQLAEIDKQMPTALGNFYCFIKNNKSDKLSIESVIGFWVLWNIKGQTPTENESKNLAPAIGRYLSKLISDLKQQ